ncbi:MAG: Tad domain-containing protein [Planctomycetota bacterium]|nr:Tad domain-containing protein [Planctomycetota bacterium]MDA1177629.1 Tad domain-containing protein [Planctomycetota bacterium]
MTLNKPPTANRFVANSKAGQRRHGAMLVLCAFLLPVLLALASLAINVAFMELCRTELRTATDSATRASGRTLALTGDENAARAAARDAGSRNTIGGQPLSLDDGDFEFGRGLRPSITSRYAFTAGGAFPNAVRITAHGPNIPQLMPGFLGNTVYEPVQIATSTQTELDVVLVLDRSGSMAYASNEPAVYPPFPAAAPVGWDYCQAAPTPSR